eukprot:3502869-Pyramimonas_sp.AAC.2
MESKIIVGLSHRQPLATLCDLVVHVSRNPIHPRSAHVFESAHCESLAGRGASLEAFRTWSADPLPKEYKVHSIKCKSTLLSNHHVLLSSLLTEF